MITETLICSSNQTFTDGLPFRTILFKDLWTSAILHDIGDLPGKIIRILNAGIGSQSIEWMMAMNGIAQAEAFSVRMSQAL